MKTNNNTTTTNTATDLYNTAERAVYIALRARHEKSATAFLTDLQNAWKNDTITRDNTTTAEEIARLMEDRADTITALAECRAMANRLTLTAKERESALNRARVLKSQLNRLTASINTLEDIMSMTFSDRADLVQNAVVQILTNEREPAEITARILAEFGAESVEDLNEEDRAEAQARANFKAVINAVGKSISALASPDALNSTKTKVQRATAEDVAQWLNSYGATGKDVKIPVSVKRARMSDCYDTMEHRDTKNQRGWYKVRHYVTTAPYQYIEDYTTDENGESDAQYIKTYDPFVNNASDLNYLEQLTERANLTDRQREFLREFARRCRYSADFKSCRAYAFKRIGITSERTQRDFFAKLKTALTTANR